MRLKILGCSGGVTRGHNSSSAIINDSVLIDAGTGAAHLSVEQVRKLKAVVLTHSHLDHTAMLPFLADCRPAGAGLDVYGLLDTLETLRVGIFNSRIWPNMEGIKISGKRMMRMTPILPFRQFKPCPGVTLTPLPVFHAVPTVGFAIHGAREDFIAINDLWDAEERVWAWCHKRAKRIKRVTMEVSFPNGMESVAQASQHLTPQLLADRMERMPPGAEVFATHIKPAHRAKVISQLRALNAKRGGKSPQFKVRILNEGDSFTIA